MPLPQLTGKMGMGSGVLGGDSGYTAYTNLRVFLKAYTPVLTSTIINKQGTFRPFATPLCVYPTPFLAIHHWVWATISTTLFQMQSLFSCSTKLWLLWVPSNFHFRLYSSSHWWHDLLKNVYTRTVHFDALRWVNGKINLSTALSTDQDRHSRSQKDSETY